MWRAMRFARVRACATACVLILSLPADAQERDAGADNAGPTGNSPTQPGAEPTEARASPAPRAGCDGSIDGHIVDVVTHDPLAGASVTMNDEIVAMTDEAGRFALTELCPGQLMLVVERPDYEIERRMIKVHAAMSVEIELRTALGEVIIVEGEKTEPVDMRSTAVVTGDALERTRGRSFTDALAEVPGLAPLGSGSGVAKPIVRGHYGRRLLLLVDGVRHRAQEWGLDHAPEIDPFVAGKITVVRGAAGVRYGPDAIGGTILVDPPGLLRVPGLAGEAHLVTVPGQGGGVAGRLQAKSARVPALSWQLEGSAKRLAAPLTPDYALDNTGSLEWNASGTAGYSIGGGDYKLAVRHYQAQLGVCSCLRIESSEDFFTQLEQEMPIDAALYGSELQIDRPYQAVSHEMALARGRWSLASAGTLTSTYAFQYDHRREFDVARSATGPQFDFRLTTHDLAVELEHSRLHITDHLHLVGSSGLTGMAQAHSYSGLPLVPDHEAWATGVYAIERLVGHDVEIEAGVRYEVMARTASIARGDFLRLVRSGQLPPGACGSEGADPVTCDSTFHTVSASVGGLLQLSQAWSGKLDLSTASRPPNPDEQYMNGTSPTFPVLALGKPDLGPETTYSASATTTYRGNRVAGEASAYSNIISDYIYFAPALDEDGQPIFDVLIRGTFPRFVTRPVDALFYGVDGGVSVTPVPGVEIGGQVSAVRARNLTDDSFLVFVPADRLRGHATVEGSPQGLGKAFASIAGTYVARQGKFDLAADLAPPPAAYFLLDAELGVETRVRNENLKIAVHGTNLLNTRYRDYTSLLRYFADQPGWQLMVRISLRFSSAQQ